MVCAFWFLVAFWTPSDKGERFSFVELYDISIITCYANPTILYTYILNIWFIISFVWQHYKGALSDSFTQIQSMVMYHWHFS